MRRFIFTLTLFLAVFAWQTGFAQPSYEWDRFGQGIVPMTINSPVNGKVSNTTLATSSSTYYLVRADNGWWNKWSNISTPYNAEFTLYWGGGSYNGPDGVLSTATSSGKYYTLNINGREYSDQQAVLMETDNAPQSFHATAATAVSTPALVNPGQAATINITLAGNKSSQEKVFVRYTKDNWSTSTVVEASGTGPTWSTASAVIPSADNTSGATIKYYAYSTTVAATNSSSHDLIALKMANNGGANYSYTVASSWISTAAGNWTNPATWLGGSTPASGQPVSIAHAVILDANVTVSSLTINSGITFTASDASPRILTITKSATGSSTTLANNGTWANGTGGSTVVFTGAPGAGDANHAVSGTSAFQHITVNKTSGSSNVGVLFGAGATVSGTMEIGTGGFVSSAPPSSFYGANAILKFNTGGAYDVGAGDYTWSTTQVPNNITISSGTVNLNADRTVVGTLIVNSGATLNIGVGINLTLLSNSSGTASVGPSAGTINGNVTVERYIPNNGFRSWRLLSVPTQGTQTINAAWQEGNAALANGTPGYGTQITSNGLLATVQAAGFDDVSPSASMLSYNGTAFAGVANTSDAIATNKGYFLYVRGDRTQGVNTSTSTTTPTTLRTSGALYQGTQTTGTIPANTFGLVGNPFASAINFEELTKPNVNNTFYIWDSKIHVNNSLGVYQTFSSTNQFKCMMAGGSYTVGVPNTAIQSGQAFFVKASPTTAGTVTIPEASKIASSGTIGFKTTADLVKLDSRLYSIASTTTMADANVVVYDVAYSNAVDGNDATKFSNTGENLGILRNGQTLVVEGRQPVTASDTIYFRMWNMQPHPYQLEFIPRNLGLQNLMAKLEDSYLNTSTTVNMSDTTRVDFTVDATPASYASNRFRVVIAPGIVLPVSFISIAASRKTTAVQVSWKLGNELSIRQYEVERSTDGRNYTKVGTLAATGITAYSLLDVHAPLGVLFYRVKGIGIAGEYKYSAVVKVTAENVNPGYAVVPNPVEGTEINVQFKNQAFGKYTVRLLNNNGQQMMNTELNHAGGNGTQTIQIPTGLAKGSYQLEIVSADKTSSVQTVLIK